MTMSDSSSDVEKQYDGSKAHIERLASQKQRTYAEPSHVDELSEEHRAYLLQRHGTLELDPIPGYGDADPYNWSLTKVSPFRYLYADTDQFPENHKLVAGRFPCHDGYLYCFFHSVCVFEYCGGSWTQSSEYELLDFLVHLRSWGCSSFLAAYL